MFTLGLGLCFGVVDVTYSRGAPAQSRALGALMPRASHAGSAPAAPWIRKTAVYRSQHTGAPQTAAIAKYTVWLLALEPKLLLDPTF